MALSRPRWHLVQDRLEPTSKGVLEKLVILESYSAGSGLKLSLTFIALSPVRWGPPPPPFTCGAHRLPRSTTCPRQPRGQDHPADPPLQSLISLRAAGAPRYHRWQDALRGSSQEAPDLASDPGARPGLPDGRLLGGDQEARPACRPHCARRGRPGATRPGRAGRKRRWD